MDYIDHLALQRHRSWAAFLEAHQSGPHESGMVGPVENDLRETRSGLREINAGGADAAQTKARRLVLLTTRASVRHVDFAFAPGDTLLLGSESSGVPDEVHRIVGARVRIALAPGLRSLNVAQAAAIVLAEALRQTGELP